MQGSPRSILDLTTLLYTGVVPLVFTKKKLFLRFSFNNLSSLKKTKMKFIIQVRKYKRQVPFWNLKLFPYRVFLLD